MRDDINFGFDEPKKEEPTQEDSAFEQWCYRWMSDRKFPNGGYFPMLTVIYYEHCKCSDELFQRYMDLIKAAFDAGAQSGEKK